jgi:hypothetical protein
MKYPSTRDYLLVSYKQIDNDHSIRSEIDMREAS